MNKTAIKNFAVWARNKLIDDIKYRAGLMGITESGIASPLPQSTGTTEFYDIGTAEPYAISGDEIKQRHHLVEIISRKAEESDYNTAYQCIIEEVAYTWFNRLIAIRFMEVNDYLPSHIRVLSSESGKVEPDLVTTPFNAELDFTSEEEQTIMRLKLDNQLDELFRMLFIKQCNALNEILPYLFEKTKDYSELLLNISVVDQEGIVHRLIHDIPEEDFDIERGGQVEIIGWMYQYYNSEPKDETFALLKKNVKITKERIPAATQLFTPDWIVRYMVENSLGRLWVEGHPNDELKANWKYYLEEAEQEPDVVAQLETIRAEYKAINPEDIKVIDPCMGSGHILVYCFDLLMKIYESQGYTKRDAAKLILKNNLYGLDIDKRAAQLGYFAVMMKARQYDRRIFLHEVKPHIYSVEESNCINLNHLKYFGSGLNVIERNSAINEMTSMIDTFVNAKEYGSILNVDNYNWSLLHRFVEDVDDSGQMTFDSVGIDETQEKLGQLLKIGQAMAQKYYIVVTNPPYMGNSGMGTKLSKYVKENYPHCKSDLFAVFIEKCGQMIKKNGYYAMITQHSWMFLASYEKLREKLLFTDMINMAHLGSRAFEEISGEVVQTTSFVIRKNHIGGYKGTYCRLVKPTTQQGKEEMFLSKSNRFIVKQDNFNKIPGSPIMYAESEKFLSLFDLVLDDKCIIKKGSDTGENDRFVRLWYEVNNMKIAFNGHNLKWIPYIKGGEARKWYGNLMHVVNWENNGVEIRNHPKSTIRNEELFFKKGITWSDIGSSGATFRFFPEDCLRDNRGPAIFSAPEIERYLLGFLNTNVCKKAQQAINPTICFQVGSAKTIPYIEPKEEEKQLVTKYVETALQISKNDWDAFETSWEFNKHPLVRGKSIVEAYNLWEKECNDRFIQLKANEEELNSIFIDIYGLRDELTPEVEDKDVSVRKADLQRDIKSLLFYAVGCMFGRYSLDKEGVTYAGGEWDGSKYNTFIPDADNVIPITDEEYLEDDIVGLLCAWLKNAYGADKLEENLDFIAKALGNKGNSTREVIRNYFLNDFMKDHIKIYQKRPIYWLFDSGKQNGFKALIYLHRYNADIIGNLRVDYLHRMQRVYESEINRMQDTIDHSTNTREVAASIKRKEKLQKQLKECREYDEKIGHLALSRIELDLDDGIKVNYEKVQTASDGKKYQVLAKI